MDYLYEERIDVRITGWNWIDVSGVDDNIWRTDYGSVHLYDNSGSYR